MDIETTDPSMRPTHGHFVGAGCSTKTLTVCVVVAAFTAGKTIESDPPSIPMGRMT